MFEFPLPTLLSLALSLLLILIPTSTSIPVSSHTKRQDATFDYVIVGGGTAGLTIANRLSEDPDVQVAVIEAGTFCKPTYVGVRNGTRLI
jgi:heterodisulfide reductase subunit A-like polyferredoxin